MFYKINYYNERELYIIKLNCNSMIISSNVRLLSQQFTITIVMVQIRARIQRVVMGFQTTLGISGKIF